MVVSDENRRRLSLAETLDEEKAADQKLNKIAASVNSEAAGAGGQPARGRKAAARPAG